MDRFKKKLQELVQTVNFDGLRCILKGDPSVREIKEALKRENEIQNGKKTT